MPWQAFGHLIWAYLYWLKRVCGAQDLGNFRAFGGDSHLGFAIHGKSMWDLGENGFRVEGMRFFGLLSYFGEGYFWVPVQGGLSCS